MNYREYFMGVSSVPANVVRIYKNSVSSPLQPTEVGSIVLPPFYDEETEARLG